MTLTFDLFCNRAVKVLQDLLQISHIIAYIGSPAVRGRWVRVGAKLGATHVVHL